MKDSTISDPFCEAELSLQCIPTTHEQILNDWNHVAYLANPSIFHLRAAGSPERQYPRASDEAEVEHLMAPPGRTGMAIGTLHGLRYACRAVQAQREKKRVPYWATTPGGFRLLRLSKSR